MKRYSLVAYFVLGNIVSACATKSNPSWDRPLVEVVNITALASLGSGISEVEVSVENNKTQDICLLKHIAEGVSSRSLSADVIDKQGQRVNSSIPDAIVKEPIKTTRLKVGAQEKWLLNYNGLYSDVGVIEKNYQFRVIIAGYYCDDPVSAYEDEIYLSSPFVSIDRIMKN